MYECTECTYQPIGRFSADFHEWSTTHVVVRLEGSHNAE